MKYTLFLFSILISCYASAQEFIAAEYPSKITPSSEVGLSLKVDGVESGQVARMNLLGLKQDESRGRNLMARQVVAEGQKIFNFSFRENK